MSTVAAPSYKAKLSIGGQSTAFTGDATTLTTGTSYQLNTSAHRKLDPAVARTWKDGGVAIPAAHIVSEDLLFGIVTLTVAPGGAVTLDASYIPTAAVADVKTGTLEESNDSVEVTKINSNGVKARAQTLQDATIDCTIINDLTVDTDPVQAGNQTLRTIIAARTPVLLELDPDGNSAHVFRAWMVPAPAKTAYDPAQVVSSTVKFMVADQGNALASAGASWGVP